MSTEKTPTQSGTGTGFLVFGMHRSGTSGLAHMLHAAGASVGERVLAGSAGNEEGHWEDAFAVELDERLLAEFGRSWDDARPLPAGWRQSEAAQAALGQIVDYLRNSRSREAVWAIKDPRMCLFAELWMAAVREADCRCTAVVLARHPLEVANSLAARDGMAPARATLLWMRHMLEAERATRAAPRVVLTYDALLRDPAGVLDRLRTIAGADLDERGIRAVRASSRHHQVARPIAPGPLSDTWHAFLHAQGDGRLDESGLDRCASTLADADAIFGPVLADVLQEQSLLWQRTARAEAALVDQEGELVEGSRSLGQRVEELGASVSSGIERILEVFSGDIRRMQSEHARTLESAAAVAADADRARRQAQEAAGRASQLDVELRALRQSLAEREQVLSETRRQISEAEVALSQLREAEATLQMRMQEQEARAGSLQRRLEHAESDLKRIMCSRSWRITRPLRLMSRLLSGRLTVEDRVRFRRVLGFRPVPAVVESEEQAEATLAAQVPGKPDVFMWAVIDWHFRTQRPQHLARGLAHAGHRVFYLSNNLVDAPEPGFRIERLDHEGRLFQVFLHASGAPAIYYALPSDDIAEQLRQGLGRLMQWADTQGAMCVVQHPFWTGVATKVPGAELVYDCMDHHAGFGDNAPDVIRAEAALVDKADLLVVTSAWLDHELESRNPRRALIRNAGDFEHFRPVPDRCFKDPQGRRIIGYYGAIAEWFDVELVRSVARAFPDCLVLLVGGDTANVVGQLEGEPNIRFEGEVPYERLPFYLHAFDVALLPFRVIPLTLATNPVKVYEYLSAGRPVVAVDLPEMRQFGTLVRCAEDRAGFVHAVGEALHEDDPTLRSQRMQFASDQTWDHRAEELDAAIAALPAPLVSVIVLTYNNLAYTEACLHSVVAESRWPNLEIIVVDNASTDGTREFLQGWVNQGPRRRIILNEDNLGFSAGNNVGLAAARGDYLVLLNNDTYVTPNWVATCVKHLARNPDIGLLGPVTNNIGNEARVDIHYADMEEMKRQAAEYTRAHMGKLMDIETVAFFCVAMPRSTYERVGAMDEAFGVGFFEDDDYCRRVQAAGLRVVCAEDVFVHHHLSATFDALKAERKKELFERNKAIYEAKWGPWKPHAYRSSDRAAPSAAPH